MAEVTRLLGHSEPIMKGQMIGSRTTYRYINADDSTLARAAQILNEFNGRPVLLPPAN